MRFAALLTALSYALFFGACGSLIGANSLHVEEHRAGMPG